jgi:glycosyltransferase involved in cell wall biosynthesis
MVRILTFSSLFPHAADPGRGIFVEMRLRKLVDSGRVQAEVVAPVPWFPSSHARFGEYARFAQAPRQEVRRGIIVRHPRFPVIPGPGWYLTPWSLALAARSALTRARTAGFDFDLIDAHYYYPDGVAAALLGRWLRKPVVITARGTDINLIPRYGLARRMILWAGRNVAASITVSEALREELIRLGAAADSVVTLRNGVDLEMFAPMPKAEARGRLGVSRRTLLSVGNLIELKGHHLVIEALQLLPDWDLLIVGGGPMRAKLETLAVSLGLKDRVRLVGAVPQSDLPVYYNAVDLMVLASSREGMPNVVLESLACATPVIATGLLGTAEIVADPVAGRLVRNRSAQAIADAVTQMAGELPAREAVRRYAERFSWDRTVQGILQLFDSVLRGDSPTARVPRLDA